VAEESGGETHIDALPSGESMARRTRRHDRGGGGIGSALVSIVMGINIWHRLAAAASAAAARRRDVAARGNVEAGVTV